MNGTQAAGGQTPADTARIQAKFELGVSTAIFNWPALSLAVQNNWGGPESGEKREWLAGATVEMFEKRSDTNVEDVETTLLQVMLDEFDVNVDDESAFELAEQIVRIRGLTLLQDFAEVDKLHEEWIQRKGKQSVSFKHVEGDDQGDTDWDTSESDESEDEEDVQMAGVAVDQPRPKEKQEPEIDEEGFTKVTGKRR